MKVRNLKFTDVENMHRANELLIFIKPFGSKLHRVFKLPVTTIDRKQLTEVLNTLCKTKHDSVWYFDLREQDVYSDIMDIFIIMGECPIVVNLDCDPNVLN